MPGLPIISTEPRREAMALAIPEISLHTLRLMEVTGWMLRTCPSTTAVCPHSPSRCPPGAVTYPLAAEAAAQGEYFVAALIQ